MYVKSLQSIVVIDSPNFLFSLCAWQRDVTHKYSTFCKAFGSDGSQIIRNLTL